MYSINEFLRKLSKIFWFNVLTFTINMLALMRNNYEGHNFLHIFTICIAVVQLIYFIGTIYNLHRQLRKEYLDSLTEEELLRYNRKKKLRKIGV